jgi:uncharacterized protein (TIGR02099 family)
LLKAYVASARWARTGARIAVGLIVGAWSLLLIAWLTLHWGILPHAQSWRPQIEQRATKALGTPVRIGNIEVRSGGWIPAFELSDVVLLDREGREALRLPRVAAAVSARSLLAMQLRFEQLLIDGAQLDVRREADGRIRVAGLDVQRDPGSSGQGLADWFFVQHEFVIRNGSVRWTDALHDAPALELSNVQFVARNGVRRHDMRLDATPPQPWGDPFSLRARFVQPLLARAGDWRRWKGSVHVDLPHADVAQLRRHVTLPFELNGGEGALRAWVDVVRGEPRTATVDMALRGVALKLAGDVDALAFDQVDGRLVMTRSERSLNVAAQRFGFVTADGVSWPQGDFSLALRHGADNSTIEGGDFSADRLDLALMAQIAGRLPLGASLRKLLLELAPKGILQGLSARWDGPPDAPQRYQVKGRVDGFSMVATPAADHDHIGQPGWRDAAVEFTATDKGGEARVSMRRGALEFPGVFDEPLLPIDELSAQVAWRIERARHADAPAQVEVKVGHARFANADAQGELSGTWRTGADTGTGRGARFPGVLDLSGKLTGARAAATARYLPRGIPVHAREYVQHAVQDGRIVGAVFKVRGDLRDFPFHHVQDGEFRIAGKVEDASFAYVPASPGQAPAWPAFTRVAGELLFDRASMEIRNARAQLWGVQLSQVNGTIRDFNAATLVIDGQARGPAADLVRYVNSTPVGEWTGQGLSQATVAGNGELKLALSLPLHDLKHSTVKGSVVLAGNDVRIRPDTPLMADARARVDFTHKGFLIVGGNARVLGGDASFEGGSGADGNLRFSGQGTVTAEGLKRASELGWLSRLASLMRGQAPYRMSLGVVHGQPELTLTSPLTGLAVDLPAPLAKNAGDTLPLRFASQLLPDAAGSPLRDQLNFELGNVLKAQYQRDVSKSQAQVLRGGIGIGDTVPTPARDVHANVLAGTFDADAWAAVLARISAQGGADPGPDGTEAYLPQAVAFRANELVAGSRRLTRVVAGFTREDTRWRASVDADQLDGYVEWRPGAPGQPGVVLARLARLSLPQAQAESVESLLEQAPASTPALDIVVDDFELRGKRLGRVEVQADNRAGGSEWRLNRLNVVTPEAQLSASGQWNARRRMVMDFQLDLADSGAFLDRLGMGGTLRGGKGALVGQVSWSGSPLSLHGPSLAGQMNLALEHGQFLKVGPGAARLLSVLSLQSLPRRLALDFRDVFQEGFPFDSVSGDITIAQGVASTNNLRMRGVQAAVLMEGQADLERETQDLRVIVVPEINAGTASLAYAAINPALGLTTFVAQMLLRKPLMAAGTREFHVSGSWDDPRVVRLERKITAPPLDTDVPPAAAAASGPRANEERRSP